MKSFIILLSQLLVFQKWKCHIEKQSLCTWDVGCALSEAWRCAREEVFLSWEYESLGVFRDLKYWLGLLLFRSGQSRAAERKEGGQNCHPLHICSAIYCTCTLHSLAPFPIPTILGCEFPMPIGERTCNCSILGLDDQINLQTIILAPIN